jgi:membrane associated rhomboid family serine protease
MIPLRDDQPRFSTPLVNYFLIVLNLLIFFAEAGLNDSALKILLFQFGLIPAHVFSMFSGSHHLNPVVVLVPFVTSMFLHGSWLHVAGNMLFLWIFGDNVEDYLGHLKYLFFYLLCGIAAAATQVVLTPHSRVPTVGASGAIAGVLGAYFILYPRARVLIWFPPIFFFHLPAWVMLGYWFVIQFLSGTVSELSYAGNANGGIAFWAHVGGFISGVVMIKIFSERPQRNRYGAFTA